MFGYIRPLKGELRVKEYEQFKAAYCGLCHVLRKCCGFPARFLINFDFTFMAMLLSEPAPPVYEYHRCIASPFRKKCCYVCDGSLETSAYYSVILYYWKLCDSIIDESFLKAIPFRIIRLLLKRSYKKAVLKAPGFDSLVREKLKDLARLETEKCPSIDMVADKFAAILESASQIIPSETHRRVMSQIFYHTGRIIYILDAVDDLQKDQASGAYNPIMHRFSLDEGKLAAEDSAVLRTTVEHSQGLLASAFELLDTSPWSDILFNIIYLGIPWITELVFAGRWSAAKAKISRVNGEGE